jgi:ribosomal protein L7/L12
MDSWAFLIVGLPVLLLLLAESSAAARRQRDTAVRLARIERKLQLVVDHLGIAEADPALPDVLRHLENGKKIHAIKAYREATGESLRDAKDAVERMAERRGL